MRVTGSVVAGLLVASLLGCSDNGSSPVPCSERVDIVRGDDFAMRQGVSSVLTARRVAQGDCADVAWSYTWTASPAGIVTLAEESDSTVRVRADNQGTAKIHVAVLTRPALRDSVGVQVFF